MPRHSPLTAWGCMIMSPVAFVDAPKCERVSSIHRFCTRTPPCGHSGSWRYFKVSGCACCGRPCTCTIIVPATGIIFVVRYGFKRHKMRYWYVTKNAAQTAIHTGRPEFPAGVKTRRRRPWLWTGEFGEYPQPRRRCLCASSRWCTLALR